MKTELSSKERIISTIDRKPVDHLPICFTGICHGGVLFVDQLYPDPFKKASFYMDLGVDTGVRLEFSFMISKEGLTIKEWDENGKNGESSILFKEYQTSAGNLRQVVRKSGSYPHDSIPLLADHNVPPGRSVKYLIDREEELEIFKHILKAPKRYEMDENIEFAEAAKDFCVKNQIMLTGNLCGIADPLIWLSGVENILFFAADDPDFLHRYIQIISEWNIRHLEILIDAGVDMVIRRGWYESSDFWSPGLYREFLYEPLKKEIEMAHQAGIKYEYIMNSGVTPLIGEISGLDLDILTNVEPEKNDIALIKKEIGDRIVLCTGVNNYHTIETGTEDEVEKEVKAAVVKLSQNGGFILAPSDSILDTSENARRNFYKMISTWKNIA